MRRMVGSVVLMLAGSLAWSVGGCHAAGGPAVATADRPPASASPGAPTPGPTPTGPSDYDRALSYTRCMTANGTKLADPVEGEPLPIGATGNSWQTVSTPAFEKCRSLLPDTWPIKADPKDAGRDKRYNECMTQHGVDMSWLVPDANGMIHSPIVDPTTYYTPQWQAADAACRGLADNPATIPLTD
jgi:hypothetical protein